MALSDVALASTPSTTGEGEGKKREKRKGGRKEGKERGRRREGERKNRR